MASLSSSSTNKKSTSSCVWKHFVQDASDDSRAICTVCNRSLSRGGKEGKFFNTTNLRKHLKSCHEEEFSNLLNEEKMLKEEQKKMQFIQKKRKLQSFFQIPTEAKKVCISDMGDTPPPPAKQLGIADSFFRKETLKKRWDINSEQSQAIHKAIGEMIALDCQPISFVEDIGFSRLMQLVKPNYVIPSRKYFSQKIIPQIKSKVLFKVKAAINESEYISFTTDIWTNNSNHSFISLTAHCINPKFERNVYIIRFAPFSGPHAGSRIAKILDTVIEEFNIPAHKIHMFVRDNAGNMAKGITDTGYSALPCFLHTLQLVIQDVLFEQQTIKNTISIIKKIVGHFSHSSLACSKLNDLQKKHQLPEHNLIQDVPTRWNSTYLMLQRIAEQKQAITSYCVETPNMPVLDANEWNMINKVSNLLKVFHDATVRLSEKGATVADIIPQIKFLEIFIEKASSSNK